MKRILITIFKIIFLFSCLSSHSKAPDGLIITKPFFMSTKSSEVNVRIGPNNRYPIKWIFTKKNEPVEVIAIFDKWYKIRDISGDEGWILSKMLSKKQIGLAVGEKNIHMYKEDNTSSKLVAEIEISASFEILKCTKDFCLVTANKIKGWVEKKHIWGITKD